MTSYCYAHEIHTSSVSAATEKCEGVQLLLMKTSSGLPWEPTARAIHSFLLKNCLFRSEHVFYIFFPFPLLYDQSSNICILWYPKNYNQKLQDILNKTVLRTNHLIFLLVKMLYSAYICNIRMLKTIFIFTYITEVEFLPDLLLVIGI